MTKSSSLKSQIQCVSNFEDLVSSSFENEVNAICWSRQLIGDFSEIVKKVKLTENITEIDEEDLLELELSPQGQMARQILMNDLELLRNNGASPSLNVIKCYHKDDSFPFFPTDVYSFHVDRSPVPTSTFLCTYHGASSEILPNEQALQKIHIPSIRAELKKMHDGPEEEFDAFLKEYFFDLHYQAKPNALPVDLGVGNLWRLAVDHPKSKVLPCVHRAPIEKDGENRLLLIC
jgi:hypothetical protein